MNRLIIKKNFKYILVVYLSIFVMVTSVTIPYSAHSCAITEHSCFNLLETSCCKNTGMDGFHHEEGEGSCCAVNLGLIDIDISLVYSNISTLPAFVLNTTTWSLPNYSKNIFLSAFHFGEEIIPAYPSLRVLQQSFLC